MTCSSQIKTLFLLLLRRRRATVYGLAVVSKAFYPWTLAGLRVGFIFSF